MRNEDVFSIGSGELLGVKGVSEAQVPIKVAELSGIRIKGNEIAVLTCFVSSLFKEGILFSRPYNNRTWAMRQLAILCHGVALRKVAMK